MYSLGYHIKRVLPVIFLGMLILSTTSCRYLKQQLNLGEYSLKAAIEWAKRDSARVADSLKRISVDKKIPEKHLPGSVKKELSEKKIFEKTLTDSLMSIGGNDLPKESPGTKYYIITGSFTNHDNAMKRAAQYEAMGYTTSIIFTSRRDGTRLEHIAIEHFSDRHEAQKFLNAFKLKFDPEAWIYTGK